MAWRTRWSGRPGSATASPVSRALTVAAPPVVEMLTAGGLLPVGHPIFIRTSVIDNGPGVPTYTWDLDGDGRFETSTGGAETR